MAAGTDEFDDDAARHAARTVRVWRQACLPDSVAVASRHFFSFNELCDMQAEVNDEAATSPVDGLPMQAVLSHEEAARTFMLGILNLVYLCRCLPWIWCLIPVLPLKKPNKPKGCMESHRPISLVAALFEILDKLLFRRIWPAIKAAASPWRGRGILGSDIMAWMVSELFRQISEDSCMTHAPMVSSHSGGSHGLDLARVTGFT